MKPLSLDALAGAAVILLQKLLDQLNSIEGLLQKLVEQSDETETLLQTIVEQNVQSNQLLQDILDAVSVPADKVLTSIKLVFKGVNPMPPIIPGPVVLTQVGQQVVAEVVGYDQFGQLWSGASFDWTLSNDNEAAATLDEQTGIVTAVANGVANITGTVTTAEGVEIIDTESVTVNIAAEEPVLTTVKVVFTQPGAGKKALPKKR